MRRLALIVLAGMMASGAWAQQQDSQDGDAPRPPRGGMGPAQAQRGMEQMQEIMRKMEKEQMEKLKANDPQAYESRVKDLQRQKEIEGIVAKARSGEMPEEQAERKLIVLLKPAMKLELDGLHERVARLEKRLALLKQAEKDPDLLLRRRAQEMLGARKPEPGENEPLW